MNIEQIQLKDVFNELNREQFIYQRSQFLNRDASDVLKFQLLTFNVGETQQIQSSLLQNMIFPGNDLYVISLQEISMKVSSLLTSEAKESKLWIETFYQIITRINSIPQDHNNHGIFFNQITKQLGGLLMIVFYNNKVKIEEINYVSCGHLGGMIANKGGIYVIAQYKLSRILLVGCHLSAGRSPDGFMQRTTHLKDILNVVLQKEQRRNVKVKKNARGILPAVTYLYNQNPQNSTLPEYKLTAWNDALGQFSAIFILGDLNYRIQLGIQQSYPLISKQEYGKLLEFDELSWLMNGTNNYQYIDSENPSKSIIPKQNKQLNNQPSNQQQMIEQQQTPSTSNFISDIFNQKSDIESLEAQSAYSTTNTSSFNTQIEQFITPTNQLQQGKQYIISTSDQAKNLSKVYQQQQNQIFFIQVTKNPLVSTFCETQIKFPPTYKIKNGQYSQQRSPSYCDRILYCVNDDSIGLSIQNYFSNFDINISDHKPVYLLGQLNGFANQQPDQQKFTLAEQEWNQVLQLFKPDLKLLSDTNIVIETLNFGEAHICPIVIQNNHQFSCVNVQIEADQPFVKITQKQIQIKAGQQVTIDATIQILDKKVQANNFSIKIQSSNTIIQFIINGTIQNINYDILAQQYQMNALLNIGHALLSTQKQSIPTNQQQNIDYFYRKLNNYSFNSELIENSIFDVYHTFSNYITNSELLTQQQLQLLEGMINNKIVMDMDDLQIYTQQYLPINQYEIVTYAIKLLLHLKKVLQYSNISLAQIQLFKFQNQKIQKIFDKIIQ